MKIRGLRVDPGLLAGFYRLPEEAAVGVVEDAVRHGVDHLFVLAFDHLRGAYYPSKAPNSWVDPVYGASGFLPKLLLQTAQAKIKVIGSFNLNRFDRIAELHPDMRVKTTRMTAYDPPLISAYASGFRTTLKAILDDCVAQNPDLAGLEAYRTSVALRLEINRDDIPDHHREATRLFLAKWPKEPVMGMKWREYRSSGIANLHKTLFEASKTLFQGQAYACQELPTIGPCDPTLMAFADYSRLSGFPWEKVQLFGLDGAILDASWQRRESGCGYGAFSPAWVLRAWAQFASMLDPISGAAPIAQVEATAYQTITGSVLAPTVDQFHESLARAFEAPGGSVASEYCELKSKGYLDAVGSIYRVAP